MKYGLYSEHEDAQAGTDEADAMLAEFGDRVRAWRTKYENAGADDTAAQEQFLCRVAEELCRHYRRDLRNQNQPNNPTKRIIDGNSN